MISDSQYKPCHNDKLKPLLQILCYNMFIKLITKNKLLNFNKIRKLFIIVFLCF